jgi:hypothetical protein
MMILLESALKIREHAGGKDSDGKFFALLME